jgi:3-hydroxybutyryl-CoA dehydrogenase
MNKRVAIIGVGTQGSMIAFRNALHGKFVTAYSRNESSREKCRARIDRFVQFYVDEKGLSEAEGKAIKDRITYVASLEEACAGAYMVIENIPEKLELKQALFAQLDQICGDDVLLSSNTSSLLMSEICRDVSPRHRANTFQVDHDDPVRNSYVEMMWNEATSEETKRRALEHYHELGFEPVITEHEQKGYSINRVWRAVKKECLKLWAKGSISPEEFDRGWMSEWHTDVAPFRLMDLIGLDTILNIEYSYYNASGDPDDLPPEKFVQFVKDGNLGMKSGSGFYTGYDTEGGNLAVGRKHK